MTQPANSLTERATAKPQASASDITVPAGDLRALINAFEKLGYNVEGLLEAAQLRSSDLADPDARLPCDSYPALIAHAQQERFVPNLALQLAAVTPIGAFPLLDYLVVTDDDVGSALRQLVRYFKLVGSPVVLELHESVGSTHVVIGGQPVPFTAEYTVSLTVLHLRAESEGRFAPASVSFSHRPDDPMEFERILGCPIHSDASWSGISLSPDAWQIPLRRRDPILRGVLERQANEEIGRVAMPDGVLAEVRRVLASRMGSGDTSPIKRSLRTCVRKLPGDTSPNPNWPSVKSHFSLATQSRLPSIARSNAGMA
jgi:hypothetical protein